MDNGTPTEGEQGTTFEVEGLTPFAQIPRWILRSGGQIPAGAVHLYGVIMTYADNTTHTAFPSRERLAADMGVSVSTIGRLIRALEKYGAITVQRRRNRRTGNFYANHYVLRFTSPAEQVQTSRSVPQITSDLRREVTSDPITRPTISTTTTKTSTRPSEMGSLEHLTRPTSKEVGLTHSLHSLASQINITEDTAQELVDEAFAIYNTFPDHITYVTDDTWDAWQDLIDSIEEATGEDVIGDMCFNKDWDERLGVIVAKHRDTEGVRYGIARWVAQIVLYVRAYPFAA